MRAGSAAVYLAKNPRPAGQLTKVLLILPGTTQDGEAKQMPSQSMQSYKMVLLLTQTQRKT